MSVSSTTLALTYLGNASTVTPYTIAFPFLETSHIKAAVEVLTRMGAVNPHLDEMTDYQFELAQLLAADPPVAGDVIRIKRTSTNTWLGSYEIAAVEFVEQDDEIRVYTITTNSSDALDFSLQNADEVYLSVADALSPSEIEVTRLADGSGGTLKTVVAVAVTNMVQIWREMPLVQPTEFQLSGPFPSTSAETALDRLMMQIQQVDRRVSARTGTAPTQGSGVRDTLVWPDDAGRGSIAPLFVGQLGVQLDLKSVWIGRATVTGGWSEAHRWNISVPVFLAREDVEDIEDVAIWTFAEDTTIRGIMVWCSSPAGSDITVTLRVGTTQIIAEGLTIPEGATYIAQPADAPGVIYPFGERITIEIVNALDGPDATQGLFLAIAADKSGTIPYVYVP